MNLNTIFPSPSLLLLLKGFKSLNGCWIITNAFSVHIFLIVLFSFGLLMRSISFLVVFFFFFFHVKAGYFPGGRLVLWLPCGSAGKESACNVGDLDSVPGLGRSPGGGKGYPLQYSGLENSMDCIVHGVAKSQTQLSNFHFTPLLWAWVQFLVWELRSHKLCSTAQPKQKANKQKKQPYVPECQQPLRFPFKQWCLQ